VIDDDELVLKSFSEFLDKEKLQYKAARSKKEAVDFAKNGKFDLVFLDLVLQDGDGVEIYKEIKELNPATNIVLTTGHRKRGEELSGKIELIGSLYKPFEMDAIFGFIEKVKAAKK
jgi:DNA-binding NtrC family response regulator